MERALSMLFPCEELSYWKTPGETAKKQQPEKHQPESLQMLTRKVINKNMKWSRDKHISYQRILSLPLPQALKKDIYEFHLCDIHGECKYHYNYI